MSPKKLKPLTPSKTICRPDRGRILTRAIFHCMLWLPDLLQIKLLPPFGVLNENIGIGLHVSSMNAFLNMLEITQGESFRVFKKSKI